MINLIGVLGLHRMRKTIVAALSLPALGGCAPAAAGPAETPTTTVVLSTAPPPAGASAEAPVAATPSVEAAGPEAPAGAGAEPAKRAAQAKDAKTAALERELEGSQLQILGALGGSTSTSTLIMGPQVGNPGSSGTGSAGLAGLAGVGAPATSAPGNAPAARAPEGIVTLGGVQVTGGAITNAAGVTAGMVPGFRRCYRKSLAGDPSSKGSLRVTTKIGAQGEVLSATPAGGGGLPSAMIACVTARVTAAQFAPPAGGSAYLTIQLTFVPQHP